MPLQNSIDANILTPLLKTSGGTGVISPLTVATAGEFAGWDANKNIPFNNSLVSQTITPTAAGTTNLTVASTYQQFFTGTTTQLVVMPNTATLVVGQSWRIINTSTGAVTVNTFASNLLVTLAANTESIITCISTAGNTAAAWHVNYDIANAGVTSVAGTANQIAVSAATGNVIISAAQNISTTSSPTFASLNLTNPKIAGAGGLVSVQVLTTGTGATYTRPANVSALVVEVLGAGGGGGGSSGGGANSRAAGSPGGAGGYAVLYVPIAAATYTYTVGLGGNPGPAGNNPGGVGGGTIFSAGSVQATGGAGGLGMSSTPNAQSNSTTCAAGGTGLNGNINVSGQPGGGSYVGLGSIYSGPGGSGHYGCGGISVPSGTGGNGGNYGSGGGGGTSSTTSAAGGFGSNGLIIVWEFS